MILTQTTLMDVEINEIRSTNTSGGSSLLTYIYIYIFFLLLKSHFYGSSRVLLGEDVQEGCGESTGEHP